MVTLLREETGGEIFPVHRLDSLTTGLMVYAKTQKAAAFLSAEITGGRFEKEYTAEVHGRPAEDKGRYEDLLYRDAKKNKSFTVKRERKGVKKAVLEYEVLDTRETPDGVFSTVKIRLLTGRTHQIRAQFSSRGMPVAGDGKYGSHLNRKAIALTSSFLSFRHPDSGDRMSFTLDTEKKDGEKNDQDTAR